MKKFTQNDCPDEGRNVLAISKNGHIYGGIVGYNMAGDVFFYLFINEKETNTCIRFAHMDCWMYVSELDDYYPRPKK